MAFSLYYVLNLIPQGFSFVLALMSLSASEKKRTFFTFKTGLAVIKPTGNSKKAKKKCLGVYVWHLPILPKDLYDF